jgi:hypothetical protein
MPARVPRAAAALLLGLALAGVVAAAAAREISLQEAVARAQREADGKVLSV